MSLHDSMRRVWQRVQHATGTGRVLLVDDSGPVQRLQIKLGADEIAEDVPHQQQYGFQSNPPLGSDVAVVFLAGERSNGVAVSSGSIQFRVRALATGEVAISDDKGQKVYLSVSGIRIEGGDLPIMVTSASKVTLDSPLTELTGDLVVKGITTVGALDQVDNGSGTTATLVGPLAVSGEISTGGINLTVHNHGGIVRGSSRTDGPLTG